MKREALLNQQRLERQAKDAATRAVRTGAQWVEGAKNRVDDGVAAYARIIQPGTSSSLPAKIARVVVDTAKKGAGVVRAGARGLEDELLQGEANKAHAWAGAVAGQGGAGGFNDRYSANLRAQEELDARDRAAHPDARLFGRDVGATGRFLGHAAAVGQGASPQAGYHFSQMDELLRNRKVEHPSVGRSLIPIAGSAQEAVADYQDGDYVGAAGNGLLAVSDVFPAKVAASVGGKVIAKKAVYIAPRGGVDPYDWKKMRKWSGESGLLKKHQIGHHGIIPDGKDTWGQRVPEWFRNQPWNLRAMPEGPKGWAVHNGIHGQFGEPQMGLVPAWTAGTPLWALAAQGWAIGRAAMHGKRAVEAAQDQE
jgi:hypothetical protein